MSLIPCADNCIYSHDGYCELNTLSIITNNVSVNGSGCVHKISKNINNHSHPLQYKKQK